MISPGCKHCYAETFAERFRGAPGRPYECGFDLRLVPEKLTEPLKWKSAKMVVVNSMTDQFHEKVPESYIQQVVRVLELGGLALCQFALPLERSAIQADTDSIHILAG